MRNIYRPNVQDIALSDRAVARGTALPQVAAGHGVRGSLAAAVRGVAAAVARSRARRAARKDLEALPHWALADIGLARSDIPRVAEAIADKLRDTGPSPDGRAPKTKLQSLVQGDPPTGHVRSISGGAPGLAGCG